MKHLFFLPTRSLQNSETLLSILIFVAIKLFVEVQ